MHFPFRKHFFLLAFAASLTACETHDRVVYSTHPVKNLRVPRPDEPSAETAAPGGENAALKAGGGPSAPTNSGATNL